MYTIYDYINYYKDSDISEVNWNMQDNLICSILAYLPINSFKLSKRFSEIDDEIKKIPNENIQGVMAPKAIEIYHILINSKRYKDMIISNFSNIRNNDTQFGAMTVRLKNITAVSFKGTDSSIIGWIENFRLAYEYPTTTQKYAIDYLKNSITFMDRCIYISGHSKGGNLAMCSALESNKHIFNRIKKIYNFDGPGFLENETTCSIFEKLNKKTVNIVPTSSMIGVLLNNKNYDVIKSNAIAFESHDPTTWQIFGQYFVSGELSQVSKQLHERTVNSVKEIEKSVLKETFESIFKTFNKEYNNRITFSMTDFLNIYKNMKNIDPKIKHSIDTIIISLTKSNKDN